MNSSKDVVSIILDVSRENLYGILTEFGGFIHTRKCNILLYKSIHQTCMEYGYIFPFGEMELIQNESFYFTTLMVRFTKFECSEYQ